MARKKKIQQELDILPEIEEPVEEIVENDEDEDMGVDEIFGSTDLHRASADINSWGGGDDYES